VTRLTKAMGRPMNETQKQQAEGQKSRQAVLDYLAGALTSPANPTTVDQVNEFKMTSWYFPILREAIDKVERSFADTEDLRKAIMLAAAYDIIERLIR
jgi:recombinational DNA repair protein RecT